MNWIDKKIKETKDFIEDLESNGDDPECYNTDIDLFTFIELLEALGDAREALTLMTYPSMQKALAKIDALGEL